MNCAQCGSSMDEFEGECRQCFGEGVTHQLSATPRRTWQWNRLVAWSVTGVITAVAAYNLSVPLWQRSQQDSVLEAALQHVTTHLKPLGNRKYQRVMLFVVVNGHDPSDAFLLHFQHAPFAVRKWSQANTVVSKNELKRTDEYFNPVGTPNYLDKNTGEQGRTLFLGEPDWQGPFEAWVAVPFALGIGHFVIKRHGGHWLVTQEYHDWEHNQGFED